MSGISRKLWAGKLLVGSGLLRLVSKRSGDIKNAPVEAAPLPNVNRLAKLMHPERQAMVITEIRDENAAMRTIHMEASDGHELAYFSAGQYIPVYVEIDGNIIERPYTISSSPEDAVNGFYEISVKRAGDGYISNHINSNWHVGDKVTLGAPGGFEVYTPLRDRQHILGIAGGSGVTPFRSMARAIADGTLDCSLTLIYGCNRKDEVAFAGEWEEYRKASNGRFDYVLVLANEDADGAERGYITADIIKKHCDINNASIFVSGPQGLMDYLHTQLDPLGLPRRYVRFGIHGDAQFAPKGGSTGAEYTIKVHQAGNALDIPARGDETVLSALERAGLKPPVHCRSGECGFCRSYLVCGEVEFVDDTHGIRRRDKELGFIHPCCSFPKSDLELVIQRR